MLSLLAMLMQVRLGLQGQPLAIQCRGLAWELRSLQVRPEEVLLHEFRHLRPSGECRPIVVLSICSLLSPDV